MEVPLRVALAQYPSGRDPAEIVAAAKAETLRAASEGSWSHAVQHRFVNQLFAGAAPDAVMAHYLIQDHRFLDNFLILLGAAPAAETGRKRSFPARFLRLDN
jgi:hypothetical protein